MLDADARAAGSAGANLHLIASRSNSHTVGRCSRRSEEKACGVGRIDLETAHTATESKESIGLAAKEGLIAGIENGEATCVHGNNGNTAIEGNDAAKSVKRKRMIQPLGGGTNNRDCVPLAIVDNTICDN